MLSQLGLDRLLMTSGWGSNLNPMITLLIYSTHALHCTDSNPLIPAQSGAVYKTQWLKLAPSVLLNLCTLVQERVQKLRYQGNRRTQTGHRWIHNLDLLLCCQLRNKGDLLPLQTSAPWHTHQTISLMQHLLFYDFKTSPASVPDV